MKIVIQGHPTRGKEVIQILESLGGRNTKKWYGDGDSRDGFFIDNDGIIKFNNLPKGYRLYTLEEFEKEFPFKVGDKVIHKEYDSPFEIIKFDPENVYPYTIDGLCEFSTKSCTLTKYQPQMKEERNIKLTLEKAKEWYKKGGELKEVALQAYSEEELTKVELPKTWEEFCNNYPMKGGMSYIDDGSNIKVISSCNNDDDFRDKVADRNMCPSKKSAEAHLAMIQLEQLRDCYRGLFVTVIGMTVWNITIYDGEPRIFQAVWGKNQSFLSFQSKEVAEEYLKNFKPLIEKAGDLIS